MSNKIISNDIIRMVQAIEDEVQLQIDEITRETIEVYNALKKQYIIEGEKQVDREYKTHVKLLRKEKNANDGEIKNKNREKLLIFKHQKINDFFQNLENQIKNEKLNEKLILDCLDKIIDNSFKCFYILSRETEFQTIIKVCNKYFSNCIIEYIKTYENDVSKEKYINLINNENKLLRSIKKINIKSDKPITDKINIESTDEEAKHKIDIKSIDKAATQKIDKIKIILKKLPDEALGGIIIVSNDGNKICDNSYKTRILNCKKNHMNKIHKLLFI